MKNGERHDVMEYPSKVIEIRAKAIEENALMKLERPIIPTGQYLYLDPTQISSIQ
jgi:hypothetical protein